jgi:hypothetical protein
MQLVAMMMMSLLLISKLCRAIILRDRRGLSLRRKPLIVDRGVRGFLAWINYSIIIKQKAVASFDSAQCTVHSPPRKKHASRLFLVKSRELPFTMMNEHYLFGTLLSKSEGGSKELCTASNKATSRYTRTTKESYNK